MPMQQLTRKTHVVVTFLCCLKNKIVGDVIVVAILLNAKSHAPKQTETFYLIEQEQMENF